MNSFTDVYCTYDRSRYVYRIWHKWLCLPCNILHLVNVLPLGLLKITSIKKNICIRLRSRMSGLIYFRCFWLWVVFNFLCLWFNLSSVWKALYWVCYFEYKIFEAKLRQTEKKPIKLAIMATRKQAKENMCIAIYIYIYYYITINKNTKINIIFGY